MIGYPAGWTLKPGVVYSTLIPPAGLSVGAIRYQERVRPLLRLGQLVARRLEVVPAFQLAQLAEPEVLTTREGEHAALVVATGEIEGRPAQRSMGFVFGDDFYARIEGVALTSEAFGPLNDIVRDLVVTDSHALGVRRRRFRYTPPPAWQALVRGFQTDWIPRRFPAEWAMITVHPANPVRESVGDMLRAFVMQQVLFGVELQEELDYREVQTSSGLVGGLASIACLQHGVRALRSVVALLDFRHVYVLEMVSRTVPLWPAHTKEFEAFWKSVRPIPVAEAAAGRGLQEHWAD
ncbi:MAG: hypothetical protein ACKV2T_43495 [Kofleriaceae bacterium]